MDNILAELRSLYSEAKQNNEFGFVLTLINYQGMGSKEDMNNLHEWFDAINFYKQKFDSLAGKEKSRIGLLLYSTFFESSDFYNILGSLCQNILGYQGSAYLYWKTKKYDRFLGTGEKISLIMEVLNDCNKLNIISFFEQNHIQEIRNTFFHSSYSLVGSQYIFHDTDPIFINGKGMRGFNVDDFLYPKINDIYNFFAEFRDLYLSYFASYTEDKIIQGFFPTLTDVEILGSNSGLIGFEIKNTAQFYGEWVNSGIYFDDQFGMWMAKNLEMRIKNLEEIEIDDRLKRYETKDEIKKSDTEFSNLVDKVIQRGTINEMKRIISLLLKFGNDRFDKYQNEQNLFKKKNLPKAILPFYKKAVEINRHLNLKVIVERIKQLENISE